MSAIKRYSHNGLRGMLEHQAGRYVSYQDYAALITQLDALAAENAALKDSVALLLEDARRVLQVEPNAGTESRINTALSLLSRAGKGGE